MAKIVVNIDTENKVDSFVEIDGKKLDHVTNLSVYGMSDTYMYIEINQFETQEGGMDKRTTLSASEKNGWKIEEKENISAEELEEFGKLLLSV